MNLSEMRTIVRRDLHDEDATNYRWTDDELDRHIAHAVSQFSQALPVEDTADIATTASSRDVDISQLSNRVMIEAVEYPIGSYPPTYRRFALWQDTLTILSDIVPDGSDARIYYGKLHTLDASSSTITTQHEDLVALGAAAYALLEWANYAINRVNVGGADTAKTYQKQGSELLARFRKELRRLGRTNKVRVRQLYTPATTPVSKSIVTGP